jgi:hypothetical protein
MHWRGDEHQRSACVATSRSETRTVFLSVFSEIRTTWLFPANFSPINQLNKRVAVFNCRWHGFCSLSRLQYHNNIAASFIRCGHLEENPSSVHSLPSDRAYAGRSGRL